MGAEQRYDSIPPSSPAWCRPWLLLGSATRCTSFYLPPHCSWILVTMGHPLLSLSHPNQRGAAWKPLPGYKCSLPLSTALEMHSSLFRISKMWPLRCQHFSETNSWFDFWRTRPPSSHS